MPLKTLKAGTFNGLNGLKVLILKGLRLSSIEKNVFAPISRLKLTSIENCGEMKINRLKNLFGTVKMNHLLIVRIQYCKWDDIIGEKTFSGLTSVLKLALAFNEIEQIEPKSFDGVFKTLKYLDLGFNRLKSLPNDLFRTNRAIIIDLVSNPWHCGCSEMEHLRLFAHTMTNVQISRLV